MSTRRLIAAAIAWRDDPDDVDVVEALQAAVDERRLLEVEDRRRSVRALPVESSVDDLPPVVAGGGPSRGKVGP